VYWLTSLYVAEEHRRKGVLSSLYRFARDQVAREPNAVGVRMQVRKHNEAGLAVAKSLGMTEEPYYLMRWVDPSGAVVSREAGIRSAL
jgi:ribosomal protein S18 acetylase RimI-like enzyme